VSKSFHKLCFDGLSFYLLFIFQHNGIHKLKKNKKII